VTIMNAQKRILTVVFFATGALLLLPDAVQAQRRGILRGRFGRTASPSVYVTPATVRYYYAPVSPPRAEYRYEEAVPSSPRVEYEGVPSEPRSETREPAPDANSAVMTVHMPSPDAELWVGGVKVPGRGMTREYTTAPLTEGERNTFTFITRWAQEGRAAQESVTVEVRPGDRLTVELDRPRRAAEPPPPPRAESGEIVPREYKEPPPE
jgi:uncharacterized protein (TIGR03000 family)